MFDDPLHSKTKAPSTMSWGFAVTCKGPVRSDLAGVVISDVQRTRDGADSLQINSCIILSKTPEGKGEVVSTEDPLMSVASQNPQTMAGVLGEGVDEEEDGKEVATGGGGGRGEGRRGASALR